MNTKVDSTQRVAVAADSTVPAIRVEGLTKDFGTNRAVDELSFEIPAGGVTGFVGPNGSGKSTTFRMLLGLIKPTSGNAWMLGHPISDPYRYIARVGALVESPALYPKLSGYKNLLALARLGRLPTSRIDEALETVDLTDRAGDRYDSYSLGMKQRLGIAAALLQKPEVLMLDEPTNGLDPAGTVEIRALFRRLAEEGTSIIVSSHLLSEIQAACDRLVMIQDGRLIFSGPLDELLAARHGSVVAITDDPSDTAHLAQLVEQAGKQVRIRDARVEVDAEPEWSAQLGRLALGAGIVLRELRPVEADLESTFLELTATDRKGSS
ncbi:MAG: multidrug ABC transporter ATP-binding protein [Actinobacteria bacterium]|nr:MAG: multidrug ABC transporter ATP-binding protein [Actinomycetota bacterium]